MGKKGKRSRRKTVIAADQASVVTAQTKIEELIEKFQKSHDLNLYSQAADELREGVQVVEATMLESSDTLFKMNLQAWFVESKTLFLSNLMVVEFDRDNFDGAIQIYKNLFERGNIDMNMKILSPIFPTLQLQYHEALLRQGKGNIDTFISLSKSLISRGRKENLELDLLRSANFLRTVKHFDAAVVLGKQLEELIGDRLSLDTTYLEQHIHIGGNKSLPDDYFLNMEYVLQKYENDGFNADNAGCMLVLAQSTYLLHQLSSDHSEEVFRKAIVFIEEYLASFWIFKSHCNTCNQTATESEVQFVCSGCRVACYCSIDHQRMSWKKEAVRGMRIGHEVLCPVMKAYRRWRHACCNDKDDEDDKVSRLRRRFERGCLYLLSDDLGLKDKCFKKK
ncbi:predicted protein [Chaetoceros tenuissimus]|uniref:MYND-type domain-containing protein n=1 Tax=Chaetoceros tenuissimus TaxID=426638 RepID=A0AAD3HA10_9STRA|nr:predicted protein [Chaetoceros tenuissimus]